MDKEFGLVGVDIGSFAMDGRQLCMLTEPEFLRYIPHNPDAFWIHLEMLKKTKFVGKSLLAL